MIDKLKSKTIRYNQYEIINFINTTDKEKELILKWRNDINVRKWMINQDTISLEEHLNYIKLLENKEDKLCFLVKDNIDYLGVVEFDNIDFSKKIGYFGLNSSMDIRLKGVGGELEVIGSYIAKKYLSLDKLKLFVFKDNIKALSLYNKSNFKETSIENNIIYMEKIL